MMPMSDSTALLEAKDLSVTYGDRRILAIPSLRVMKDEVLAIVGPNGSGKTTLVLCMSLLLRPTTGSIFYNGVAATARDKTRMRRDFAVVFQEPLLLSTSVMDNVTLALRLRGLDRQEARRRGLDWLERFGIAHLASRHARTLSGGEAQRASLARAFALQPKILFLDEPFAALDSATRMSLLEDLSAILKSTGTTALLVTHNHDEALLLADRMAVLIAGAIHQIGSPLEAFYKPADVEVASFVECGNVLSGTVSSSNSVGVAVRVDGKEIDAASDVAVGSPVTAFIRYDSVCVYGLEPCGTQNRLEGRITSVFPFGPEVRVTVDCGFRLSAVMGTKAWQQLALMVGQPVQVTFEPSSVHLIPDK
jgi:tungstate transport system ATP-binding protein